MRSAGVAWLSLEALWERTDTTWRTSISTGGRVTLRDLNILSTGTGEMVSYTVRAKRVINLSYYPSNLIFFVKMNLPEI